MILRRERFLPYFLVRSLLVFTKGGRKRLYLLGVSLFVIR